MPKRPPPAAIAQDFRERLRQLLWAYERHHGTRVSLELLAHWINTVYGPEVRVTRNHLTNWVYGDWLGPRYEMLVALASYFEVPLAYFDPRVDPQEMLPRAS